MLDVLLENIFKVNVCIAFHGNMGALQGGPGGPWHTQNFGWVGHNAFGPINNCPVCSLIPRKISTRNTSDCDQSNYSSRIVFSHMSIEFGQTGNSVIRSADPDNPT